MAVTYSLDFTNYSRGIKPLLLFYSCSDFSFTNRGFKEKNLLLAIRIFALEVMVALFMSFVLLSFRVVFRSSFFKEWEVLKFFTELFTELDWF